MHAEILQCLFCPALAYAKWCLPSFASLSSCTVWCFMHITAYLSVLCVVCPLVLGCQGKACLSTCCLSPGVLKEVPGEGMSVGFVPCMGQVNAQVRTRTS